MILGSHPSCSGVFNSLQLRINKMFEKKDISDSRYHQLGLKTVRLLEDIQVVSNSELNLHVNCHY